MAEVFVTDEVYKQLTELPRVIRPRIARIFKRLEQWPDVSGAKALTRNLAGRFRMRTGDYRVQFFIDGERVIVEKVGHRDGFYGE